jgi:DNA replication protein DnaC
MKKIENAFDEVAKIVKKNIVVQNSSVNCSICGEEVKAIKLDIPGLQIERWVQPKCKCEVEAFDKEQLAFQRKTEELEVRKLFSISQLGEKLSSASFNNFQIRSGSEIAYKASKNYCDGFNPKNPTALILWGEPGNGKSLLAACVNNELQKNGHTTIFVSMPDLLTKIKQTFNNDRENEEQILKALDICDLLIIDDLGAEKTSDWVEETIFKIIDNRYRKKKPILITSNVSPYELSKKIGSRSTDRILEMCIEIKNDAKSYRTQKAQSMKDAMLKKLMEG